MSWTTWGQDWPLTGRRVHPQVFYSLGRHHRSAFGVGKVLFILLIFGLSTETHRVNYDNHK